VLEIAVDAVLAFVKLLDRAVGQADRVDALLTGLEGDWLEPPDVTRLHPDTLADRGRARAAAGPIQSETFRQSSSMSTILKFGSTRLPKLRARA
jgi:hypothetical protein